MYHVAKCRNKDGSTREVLLPAGGKSLPFVVVHAGRAYTLTDKINRVYEQARAYFARGVDTVHDCEQEHTCDSCEREFCNDCAGGYTDKDYDGAPDGAHLCGDCWRAEGGE